MYKKKNELKEFRKLKYNEMVDKLQYLQNEKLKRVASVFKGSKSYAQVKESRGNINQINRSIARLKTIMLEKTRG